MDSVTLIAAYYRQPHMLARQLEAWAKYTMQIIVVDDGSPEPAADVLAGERLGGRLSLYRIDADIPWNRGGARNLGSHVADSEWLVHVDIDHVMPSDAPLQAFQADSGHWYRFPRYRVGMADDTRRKDAIADDVRFGRIKPHMDSYLCTRSLYWRCGGYDEDYSGCLGGGTPFTQMLERVGGSSKLLPEDVMLHVYTRDVCPDASVRTLSRDTSEYKRRKKAKGIVKGKNPLRFEWHKE